MSSSLGVCNINFGYVIEEQKQENMVKHFAGKLINMLLAPSFIANDNNSSNKYSLQNKNALLVFILVNDPIFLIDNFNFYKQLLLYLEVYTIHSL